MSIFSTYIWIRRGGQETDKKKKKKPMKIDSSKGKYQKQGKR